MTADGTLAADAQTAGAGSTADGQPGVTADADTFTAVEGAARGARGAVADLAGVPAAGRGAPLRGRADQLGRRAGAELRANRAGMRGGRGVWRPRWARPSSTPP